MVTELKEGYTVFLGTTDDEDLNDFLEFYKNPKIVVTHVEEDYFWGVALDERVQVPYHMEARDITALYPTNYKIEDFCEEVEKCSICGGFHPVNTECNACKVKEI